MRDLASRLRDIVRRDAERSSRASSAADPIEPGPDERVRELTYVPDLGFADPMRAAAEQLGGETVGADHGCVAIDRVYAVDRSHGRMRIEACVPNPVAPIHLFDPAVGACADWWRHIVFFDIETTGLGGGAGTLAFLAGCGWFDETGFRVRQFFLAAPSGERAMLRALADVLGGASLLVTYNGRTFDVPFMETRWAYHRTANPTDALLHFDMLPPARRLWGRRDVAGDDRGCSLSTLERAVLGVHRVGDVPGFEIPARYFQFLRTGDASAIEGVLEHNRYDLVSLAALMSRALWLAGEGPDACREPSEQLALGRLYERANDTAGAGRAFEMAARSFDGDVKRQALAHLAIGLRRRGRFQEAVVHWQQVLEMASASDEPLSSIERQAAEALAIHHEHRARDPIEARRYASLLRSSAQVTRSRPSALDGTGERVDQIEHRLRRLNRKIDARKTKDGPEAVPLLHE